MADDPVERRLAALVNVFTLCHGASVVLMVSDLQNSPGSRRLYSNAWLPPRDQIWVRWRTPSLSAARHYELSDEVALRARGIFVDRPHRRRPDLVPLHT